ncbi:MAG TPA: hypothetical protein VE569_10535 [Acidimicrobiia bacterium]|jgi:hypothetical protein|nr:hypothetical protein [Acidimicrobiia bacterium]
MPLLEFKGVTRLEVKPEALVAKNLDKRRAVLAVLHRFPGEDSSTAVKVDVSWSSERTNGNPFSLRTVSQEEDVEDLFFFLAHERNRAFFRG